MDTIHLKVNLNFQQLIEMIKQLSPSEKLELNEFLWNDAMEDRALKKQLVAVFSDRASWRVGVFNFRTRQGDTYGILTA